MNTRSTLFIVIACCTSGLACSDLVGADFEDVHLRPNGRPRAEDAVLENVVEGTEGNTLQLVASDPEQDPLTYELASDPRGDVSFSPTGLLSYASRYGVWKARPDDIFQYFVQDRAPSPAATVTVRLLPAGPELLTPTSAPPKAVREIPGDPQRSSYFGASLDFDGADRAIIGSTGDGAYVLQHQADGAWAYREKIEPMADGGLTADDLRVRAFGSKAALSGEWALVSAFGDPFATPAPSGRAYFYKLGSLADPSYKPQVVCASPPNCDGPRDAFGFELALEGAYAVIAARDESLADPKDPSKSLDGAGAVYVYELVGEQWKQLAKLRAPEPGPGDLFGSSIALDGETLVVAASGTDTRINDLETSVNTGALYLYKNNRWRHPDPRHPDAAPEQLRLPLFEPQDNAKYEVGQVALSGNYLLCGTPEAPIVNGAAFIYDRARAQWERLDPPETAPPKPQMMRFGHAVAIQGDIAVVSHLDKSKDGSGYGGAIMYRREIEQPGDQVRWRQRRVWEGDLRTSAGWVVAAHGTSVLVGATHGGLNGHAYAFHVPLLPGVVFTEWKD